MAAFETDARGSPWQYAGWVAVVGAALILSYYSVIAGWALKYFFGAASGALWQSATDGYGAYFEDFISHKAEPLLWQLVLLAMTAVVVAAGLKGGIERINMWLMPLLALMVVLLAVFALTLPGSSKGVSFLFAPDWSALARPAVYLNALGQAFFSLGVGMAVFITYGSYLSRETHIPRAAATVAVGDVLFAIVAGLAIFPAVFALGGDPAAGPRLAFITLPQVLLQMPGGHWIGVLFFLLLSAAALTSMIALLEVPVAVAANRLGWSRPRAAVIVATAVFALGIPSALSYGVLGEWRLGGQPLLDAIDHGVSNFLLPVCGLSIALYVGWQIAPADARQAADLTRPAIGTVWLWLLRIGVPVTIAVILMRSLSLI